jgi:hypothetical protein
MQNKPNFPHFSTENDDFTKKQTQFKPNQSQFWANIKGGKAKQTQFIIFGFSASLTIINALKLKISLKCKKQKRLIDALCRLIELLKKHRYLIIDC